MLIKLKVEWLGKPAGYVVSVPEHMAQRLIHRGSAEPYEEKEEKAVRRPPRDKAVKSSTDK